MSDLSDKSAVDHIVTNWHRIDSYLQRRIIYLVECEIGCNDTEEEEEPELLVDEMKRELFEEAAQKYTLEQLHELLKI